MNKNNGFRFLLFLAFLLTTLNIQATDRACLEDYFTSLFAKQAGSPLPPLAIPTTESMRIALHDTLWPSSFSTGATFAQMVKEKRFECAEMAFRDLDRLGIKFQDGSTKTVALLSSARDLVHWNQGMTVEEIKTLMEEWKRQVPDSVIADIYWVKLLHAAAWHSRGSGLANEVAPEQWKQFNARNEAAKQRIEQASPESKANLLWPYAVEPVMADTEASQRDLELYALKSVAEFPDEIRYVFTPAHRLTELWGGTPEKFEAFAQEVLAATKQTNGNKVYALIYMKYQRPRLLPSNKYVDHKALLAGLMEGVNQPFSPLTLNDLETYACAMRNKEAYMLAGKIWLAEMSKEHGAPKTQAVDADCRNWAMHNFNEPQSNSRKNEAGTKKSQ